MLPVNGGSPTGKRSKGSLVRKIQERKGGDVRPDLNQANVVDALMSNLKDEGFAPGAQNQNDYTPLDFGKQVYEFPGKVYDDADATVRGLIGVLGNIAEGDTPYDAGLNPGEIAEETLHNWTHPVEYANEHPFGFMADIAGVAAGGEAALGRASAARGASIPEWLGSEEGAIGRLGEQLERGYEPTSVEPYGDKLFNNVYSAAEPDIATATFPDLEGKVVVKPVKPPVQLDEGRIFRPPNQALNEAAASELNARTGDLVRMPGTGFYEDVPYRARVRNPGAGKGYMRGYSGALEEPVRGPGSLTEYVEGLNAGPYGNGLEEFSDWTNPGTPEWVDQMRKQNIFDQVIGNADRSYGANLFEHEGLPIAIDQGSSFPRQMGLDSFYEPRAWAADAKNLSPDELTWVSKLVETLGLNEGRGGTALGRLEGSSLRNAIHRAREILENRKLDPDFGWHNNLGI